MRFQQRLSSKHRWGSTSGQCAIQGRVRPEPLRSKNRSRGLLDVVVPVVLPTVVGTVQAQCEHPFGILWCPPGTGAFQALLHDVAVRAFDFPRTDQQGARQGTLVVELVGAIAESACRVRSPWPAVVAR